LRKGQEFGEELCHVKHSKNSRTSEMTRSNYRLVDYHLPFNAGTEIQFNVGVWERLLTEYISASRNGRQHNSNPGLLSVRKKVSFGD